MKASPQARVAMLAAFLLTSAAAGAWAYAQGWVRPELIPELVESAGPTGMVIFVAVVVAAQVLWMPRMWGLVAGGVLFGPLAGALLSLVADMVGAAICYAIARGGGRDWVLSKVEGNPRAERVLALLSRRRAGVIVALTRVLPIMHYTFTHYLAGVAGVRTAPFLIGTFVGLLPFAFLVPFVGRAALEPTSPTFLIGLAVMCVVVLVASVLARRVLRGAPGAREPEDEGR